MCKTSTYTNKEVGVFNLQWNTVSIPWLLIGMFMVGFLWFLLATRKHCKQRSRRQILSDRNLELQNHKMLSIPFFSNPFLQFQAPVPPPQFSQSGGGSQQQSVPPYAAIQEFHPLTSKLNSALVWWNEESGQSSKCVCFWFSMKWNQNQISCLFCESRILYLYGY